VKAIVEQYAKGNFVIERPKVRISETSFQLNIEAGTVYSGRFTVESLNNLPIKGMVFDSRYLLRFESHEFISRKFVVNYIFDATCLEAGQNFCGHINVVTDGGEFRIPYDISILPACVRYGTERVDDLFKFAAVAENDWSNAARLFESADFRRTFIDKVPHLKQVYESLLESRSVNQALEEFLVLVHKKRTVTLSAAKSKIDIERPTETKYFEIDINKSTWGYTSSDVRSDCDYIQPMQKLLTGNDFSGSHAVIGVQILPEHLPDGESCGHIYIENIYQRVEIEIHLSNKDQVKRDSESRMKEQEFMQCKVNLTQAYLDFRMDLIGLDEYVADTIEALKNLSSMDPEENLYRLGIIHMNILKGNFSKVEQEFLRIEADVDRNRMTNQEKCYLAYLKAMMARDDETVEKTANMLKRNYRTQEPKMFYFWLLLFVDRSFAEDKGTLYRELEQMFEDGENNPILYFEMCELLSENPLLLKKLDAFEVTTIKWGMRHNYISEDVLDMFVKLAGKGRAYNRQIFDTLRSIYDRNEAELRKARIEAAEYAESMLIPETKKTAEGLIHWEKATDDVPEEETLTGKEREEKEYAERLAELEMRAGLDGAGKKDGMEAIFGEKEQKKIEPIILHAEEEETDPLDLSTGKASKSASYDPEAARVEAITRESFAETYDEKLDEALRTEIAEKTIKRESQNLAVLESICTMLLAADMLDVKYHRFYKAAVEKGLKYMGLNECFIRSMNHAKYEIIPPAVLMYLSYKNTLSESDLAYLYANVIFNKAEHAKIYYDYAPQMQDFMEKMIVRGEVSDDLTVIYDEFLDPETVSSLFAGKLINIIFRRKLVCENHNIRAVIVSHAEIKDVQRVLIEDGEAYVEVFSDNASIIFEDNKGNRYAGSIPYHFERIVDEKAYMPICKEYSPRDYRVLLYNYKNLGEFTYKNATEVNAAREIINCEELSDDFKMEACLQIIEYYHENLDTDVLVKYLNRLELEYLTHASARTIISYLIDMNMFDKAFQAVKLYGFNELDVNELYRLADYGVRDSEGFLNEDLMAICLNLYKTGTVNATILTYLISNFNGSVEELTNLFKQGKDRVQEIGLLAENTLAQSMFANVYMEYIYDVFQTYYSGRNRGLVVKAFLRLSARNYLLRDMQVPNYIFDALFNEIQKGNIDDEVSFMALLLYFSRLERYQAEEKHWIRETVERFIDAGKILPFFKNFNSFIRLPQDVFLKTYLVYKTVRPRQVYVKYSFDTGTRPGVHEKVQRMEEIVSGLYVMEFVVFHGERLEYVIPDDPKGNARIIESEVLKKKSFAEKNLNRFELINSMLVKQEMRADRDLLQDLDVYINTVHLFEENMNLL